MSSQHTASWYGSKCILHCHGNHSLYSRSDTSTVWPLPSHVPRPCTFVTCSTNSVQILYCMQVTNVQRPENKATPPTLLFNEWRNLMNGWSICLSDLCKKKINYNIQKMKLLCIITQFNSWQIVQGTFRRRLKPHPCHTPLSQSMCHEVLRSANLCEKGMLPW